MQAGRDVWWHDVVAGQHASCEPEWWTRSTRCSFSTPRAQPEDPKGIQHSSAGYLLNAKLEHAVDFRCEGYRRVLVHCGCFGWVTGHTYVVYGRLRRVPQW